MYQCGLIKGKREDSSHLKVDGGQPKSSSHTKNNRYRTTISVPTAHAKLSKTYFNLTCLDKEKLCIRSQEHHTSMKVGASQHGAASELAHKWSNVSEILEENLSQQASEGTGQGPQTYSQNNSRLVSHFTPGFRFKLMVGFESVKPQEEPIVLWETEDGLQ